ncbi:hypothetical protein [Salinicoccus sp. HZC-1]|uniref:hypothetical protein n=1 Tax=Salinicoccus sp. HZC-1 TaxID=3385497 RepID=UPI00398B1E2B
MFSYHEINLYLDGIDLPKPLSEITEEPHDFNGLEFQFLMNVKKYLSEKLDYESYRSKVVHCIGTCRYNLTQIGLYLLLEDEIIFVHTSTLKFNEESPEWSVSFYPYKEVVSLEFNDDDFNRGNYESGVMFIKLSNAKGITRTKTIRNVNPNHFDCVREFHTKMLQQRYI